MISITTNANRVKAAGYWCEDADEQTNEFLSAAGLTWDMEVPIADGIKGLGLANTLLALGAPHPRFKDRANQALEKYLGNLLAIAYAHNLNTKPTYLVTAANHLIAPRYSAARKEYVKHWENEKRKSSSPYESQIAESLMILFSEEPLQIKAIHAGKALLTAMLIKEPKRDLYGELAAKLTEILENT